MCRWRNGERIATRNRRAEVKFQSGSLLSLARNSLTHSWGYLRVSEYNETDRNSISTLWFSLPIGISSHNNGLNGMPFIWKINTYSQKILHVIFTRKKELKKRNLHYKYVSVLINSQSVQKPLNTYHKPLKTYHKPLKTYHKPLKIYQSIDNSKGFLNTHFNVIKYLTNDISIIWLQFCHWNLKENMHQYESISKII